MRNVLMIAAIAGVVYYLYSHRATDTAPSSGSSAPSGAASTTAGYECLRQAEQASQSLSSAASTAARPPVDANAWSSLESSVSSAISSAESACGSATSDREKQAADEIRLACGTMRTMLGELSSAAKGSGGAADAARRQEEIDAHLDRARSLLK